MGDLHQLLPAVQIARPTPACGWVLVRAHPDAWRALQPDDLPCLTRRLAPLEPVIVCQPGAAEPSELFGPEHLLRLAGRVDRSALRWESWKGATTPQQDLSVPGMAAPEATSADMCPNCGSSDGFDQVTRCLICRQPCPSYL